MTAIELTVSGVILGYLLYAVLRQRLGTHRRSVPVLWLFPGFWIIWICADFVWFQYSRAPLGWYSDVYQERPGTVDIQLYFTAEELRLCDETDAHNWAPQCGG